jgi:hypothetical protein
MARHTTNKSIKTTESNMVIKAIVSVNLLISIAILYVLLKG